MKYENKSKVDELCERISYLSKLYVLVESSATVEFRSNGGYPQLCLEIDANKESSPLLFMTNKAKSFRKEILDSINNQILTLKKELEKL